MLSFILACQRNGKLTSGGMFIVWVLFALCGLPEFYWWIVVGVSPLVYFNLFLFCYNNFLEHPNGHFSLFSIFDLVFMYFNSSCFVFFCGYPF